MSRKNLFLTSLILILLFGLIIRLLPTHSNNFYFTIDQGTDAINTREIVQRSQIPLLGPETNIYGLHAGPYYYYFLSLGYFLFQGHPFGAVFLQIILNLTLTALIMSIIWKKVSLRAAIFLGLALQIFWPFFDTSRFSFNPFYHVFLTFSTLFLLTKFLEGKKNYYILAAIPVGLGFHFEIAYAIGVFLFYLLVGLWSFWKKYLEFSYLITSIVVLILVQTPQLISELQTDFSQLRTIIDQFHTEGSEVKSSQFKFMLQTFSQMLGTTAIAQNWPLGIIIYLTTIILFLRGKKHSTWLKKFILLSLSLFILSYFWFGSTLGWRTWHTVTLPPLLFITLLLMILKLPQKIAFFLILIIISSQSLFFGQRYRESLTISDDPAILHNQLVAIDWVYQNANGQGFYAYTYEPSVYDTTSQYLFWWYGRKKYGYVPCEYSSYPGSPDTFVPGWKYYQSPKKPCQKIRFLIIYPDQNKHLRNMWYENLSKDTTLVKKSHSGKILLEKRTTK